MFKNPFLHFATKIYGWIITGGGNLQSLFLLWMRMTWGHQFMMTGYKKLIEAENTTQFFSNLNIPAPHFSTYLVGYTELIGGILLFTGLASRLIAVPLSIIMLVALGTYHYPNLAHFRIFTDPSSLVHEAPYPFLITCILVLAFGPGRISLDAWIKRWVEKQPKY